MMETSSFYAAQSGAFASPQTDPSAAVHHAAPQATLGNQQLLSLNNQQLTNSGNYYHQPAPQSASSRPRNHHLSHNNLSLMNLNRIPLPSQSNLTVPTGISSYGQPQSGHGQPNSFQSFHGSLTNINVMAALAAQQQHDNFNHDGQLNGNANPQAHGHGLGHTNLTGLTDGLSLATGLPAASASLHHRLSAASATPAGVTIGVTVAPNDNSGTLQNGALVYPSRPASASASLLGGNAHAHGHSQQRYLPSTAASAAQRAAETPQNLLMIAPDSLGFADNSHLQVPTKLERNPTGYASPAHAMRSLAALDTASNSLAYTASVSAGSPRMTPGAVDLVGTGLSGCASPSESCGSLSNTPSGAQTAGDGSGSYALVHKKRRYKEMAIMQPDGNGQPAYLCGVCGDRALGYNFDAITCESCKAFFRRNAQKMKPLKCNFDGNCKIDPQTRKFCPGCRLKKCFSIGMRREWILSEEQLALRRQKGRVNKIRRQQQHFQHTFQHSSLQGLALLPGSTGALLDSAAASQFLHVPDAFFTDPSSHNAQRTASATHSMSPSRSSSSLYSSPSNVDQTAAAFSYRTANVPPEAPNVELKPFIAAPSDNASRQVTAQTLLGSLAAVQGQLGSQNSGPSTLAAATSGGCESYVSAATQPTSSTSGAPTSWCTLRPLSEVDTILLDILQRLLYEVMEAVIDTDLLADEGEQSSPTDQIGSTSRRMGARAQPQPPDIEPHVGNYLKLTDSFIRRFIKFCKCVPEFAQLKQDDQIALLKGGVMEAIVLRGAIIYDAATRRWHFHCPWTTENQIRAVSVDCVRRSLESFADGVAFLDAYLRFLDSLFELTQRNRLVMLLLFLVELFSTDRAGLSNKLQVSQAQEKYLALLRHYLESQFDHATVRRLFPDLLLKLVDARDVASGLNRIFVQVDWSNVEPLVGEMFARFTQR